MNSVPARSERNSPSARRSLFNPSSRHLIAPKHAALAGPRRPARGPSRSPRARVAEGTITQSLRLNASMLVPARSPRSRDIARAVSRPGGLRRALLVLGVQQRCKLRHGLLPRCRLSTNQHHALGANASWNTHSAPESNVPHAIGASLDAKLHPVALRSGREASFKVINHAFERIAAASGSSFRRESAFSEITT